MTENLPTKPEPRDPLKSLLNQDAIKRRFEGMLGKKAAGFMSSIISATQANRELSKADPLSIVAAAAVAASLDLPINPSLGFAHIVPYKKDGYPIAQFQMGYRGFIQLGMRTGQYKTINACEVYEGELQRSNRFTGEMEFDENQRTSDTVIGYVAYFKLINGFEKWLYMTVDQIHAHAKQYSQSYNNPKGRWQVDFPAMARKTVIKMLLSHYGILSIEMQTAIQADQAVVREMGGKYSYPDGMDAETIDADTDDEPKTEPPEELIKRFDASIPPKADHSLVNAFLVKVAEGNHKTIDEIKIAAAQDKKELDGLWKLFPAWCKTQKAQKKQPEPDEMAPLPCPNNPEVTYKKSICDECKSREGCPAWD